MGDIILEDELGKTLSVYPSNIQGIISLIFKNISEDELEKTFCLQFIDPYGDTTFNQIQTRVLIKEFEELLENSQNEDAIQIKSIIEFISNCGTHQYIKFIGD